MNFDLIECPGADAIAQLENLRAEFSASKKYPFLIGDKKAVEALREFMGIDSREPSIIIAESLSLDLAAWLKAQEVQARQSEFDKEFEFDEEEMLGEWMGESPEKGEIILHRDLLSGAIKQTVYLGLAEIDQPWMLPAVTKYGGWNDCPEAAIHCAIMHYWGDRYGAEIMSMSNDVIECWVKNPPVTQEAAVKLAWEQFWYCGDIVYQGTETISNLAAGLLNSDYWYFWWD